MTPQDFQATIKNLDPISTLNEKNFETFLGKAEIIEIKPNSALFRQGDVDKCHYFLLDGTLKLASTLEDESTITPESEQAREAIAHHQPRKHTAAAKTACTLLRIESKTLDMILSWDHASKYTVKELTPESRDQAEHWMESWLSTPVAQLIEPGTLQTVTSSFEQQNYHPGNDIISQNTQGDFVYILSEGTASVTRTTKAHPAGIELAKLYPGDMFGEDALLSGRPRSASVTMIEEGSVQRLDASRFLDQIAKPLIRQRSYEQASSDDSLWLDVRLPAEHQRFALPGSINIPLIYLRIKHSHLDRGQKYVVYCDNGSRSAAAAFVLLNAGFDVAVLKGGLHLAKNSLTMVSRSRVVELEAS